MGKHLHHKHSWHYYITEMSNSVSLWSKTSGTYEHSFSTIRLSFSFVDLVKLKTAIIMFRAFRNELPSNLANI